MLDLEFEEDRARRDYIAMQLLKLQGNRSDLVSDNIACYSNISL